MALGTHEGNDPAGPPGWLRADWIRFKAPVSGFRVQGLGFLLKGSIRITLGITIRVTIRLLGLRVWTSGLGLRVQCFGCFQKQF